MRGDVNIQRMTVTTKICQGIKDDGGGVETKARLNSGYCPQANLFSLL